MGRKNRNSQFAFNKITLKSPNLVMLGPKHKIPRFLRENQCPASGEAGPAGWRTGIIHFTGPAGRGQDRFFLGAGWPGGKT